MVSLGSNQIFNLLSEYANDIQLIYIFFIDKRIYKNQRLSYLVMIAGKGCTWDKVYINLNQINYEIFKILYFNQEKT